MKRVRADFAPRRPVSNGLWFTLVALTAGAAALVLAERHVSRNADTARAEAAAVHAAAEAAVRTQAPAVAPPKPYDASAREMLSQYTTPWPQMLVALEAVQVTGVRVQSIDYTASDASVRVEIVFAAQSQALEYLAELNAGVPPTSAAWRWAVLRMEQGRGEATGRALLHGRWVDR